MIGINEVTSLEHFEIVENLASVIWREHYPSIISIAQIDYMLAKFNSIKAIEEQIHSGTKFYVMTYNEVPVGYMAIKNEVDYLFLSKLYVLKMYRGKGIGVFSTEFIMSEASRSNKNSIKLTVNKFNTKSILVYEKLGFKKVRAIKTDIGDGFVMDDYEMVKDI